MEVGKILTTSVENLEINNLEYWWYNKYYENNGYNKLKEIGYDINFNKHYNHGIEIRFLDHITEDKKIFESFDGLMLVSAIIGLMNEKTGLVYYLNLEHPNLILYRSKVASYIELSKSTPKIGTPYIKKPKEVNLFQLFTGDILFLGSDGKDDLMKNTGEAHEKYNYDESQFLRIIEQSEGNMEEIIKIIPEYGIIIDDFSILKIAYT